MVEVFSAKMNESILKALMQLFAMVADVDRHGTAGLSRDVVETYLENEFGAEQVKNYLKQFDEYISLYHPYKNLVEQSREHYHYPISEKVNEIVHGINQEFEQHQKVWLILQLVEFIGDSRISSGNKLDFVKTVATHFNISEFEFNNGKDFILCDDKVNIPWNEQVLLIDSNKDNLVPEIKHIYNQNLIGQIYVLRISSTNTYLFKYFGESDLFLNSRNIIPKRAYIFGVGAVIRGSRINPIYYSKVSGEFIKDLSKTFVTYTTEKIEYRFKGSEDGIYPFSFSAHSGQFIGIMGGSGVGKSTLVNLLNGNLKPLKGDIQINGYDLNKEGKNLKGVIGYIPQDDLLIEELTVYQNLYFSASLCFKDFTEEKITALINKTLLDFDLFEAKDLKVGDPINKFISGGQRKRLNIGMELMREPSILFVDEPTSGLSSMDSERIVLLLKKQTLKGKIVFTNIHQPSSDIFKLFDKVIILDRGGRVIFQGNPMHAVIYFKQIARYLKSDESECLTCGNVNTELILKIVEARVVNEYGKLTRKRKRSAQEWYELYLKNIESKITITRSNGHAPLPENSFRIPSRRKQMWIFFKRNLQSKLVNQQFMYISLLAAPLLAVILGYFTKFISGSTADPNSYIFSNNDNIPSYLFMSVVAMIFLGLTISAEDIIRDRKVRLREKFLNLNYFSYINSKVIVLLIFSAIQAFLFVALGNTILGIKGMFFYHWLILFSTAVCSNLIGLNISAALNSVVAIYVLIPLIIVPQLLFSGVIVNFNKLHKSIANPEYVPVIGDVMVSRWAYEAICVHQFSANRFEKEFFNYNKELSNYSYYASFLVPKLQLLLDETEKNIVLNQNYPLVNDQLQIVQNELTNIKSIFPFTKISFPANDSVSATGIPIQNIDLTRSTLNQIRSTLNQYYSIVSKKRDKHYDSLAQEMGGYNKLHQLKMEYTNKALESLVLNKNEIDKLVISGTRIIRKYDPVYAPPTSTTGRAQLFASEKRLGLFTIPTFWFNLMAMWLMSTLFYVVLWTNLLRSISKYMERFKFRRLAKRIAKYIPR